MFEIGPRTPTGGTEFYGPLTDEYTRVINGTEYMFFRYVEPDGSIFVGSELAGVSEWGKVRNNFHCFTSVEW